MREPTFDNRNENYISIKSDSNVELIRELAKLGVFKSKKKQRKTTIIDDEIKQESDMIGYTKSVDMRNLPPIQQIEPGATQNQIEDIQRQNNAVVSALRSEVMQNRVEDINRIGNALYNVAQNRFRPTNDSKDKPYDPFAKKDVILLGNEIPDVQQERFDQTINEGGPEAVEKTQTSIFPKDTGDETFRFDDPTSPTNPVYSKKGKASTRRRAEIAVGLGISAIPIFKSTSRPDMEAYYRTLSDVTQNDIDESVLTSKQKMFEEINSILDSYVA